MGTTKRRTQAERRELTRHQLLEAAASVFAAKGYRDATMVDIASTAGLSTGALYNHFAGKRDVFLAVFDERFIDWSASYDAAVSASGDADTALREAAHHYDALLRSRPADTQLLIEFWSVAMRDESLRSAFVERHGQIRAAMATIITKTLGHLGIAPAIPATDLGAIVTALADGLAMQRLIEPTAAQSDQADLLRSALRLLFVPSAGK